MTTAWPVLFHVNAISLLDEGAGTVLDLMRERAAATGVMLAVHGFNPEVVDRGRTWPGHGPQGSHGGLGGYFATAHDAYYAGLRLGPPHVAEPPLRGFDALAEVTGPAKARGLDVYVYILESAGTGGYQRNVRGWPGVLEIDIAGRRAGLPCVNHPDYRAWKLALIEDLYKSYAFDGMLWGVERWGPLHQALAGGSPGCFCPHCAAVAERAGLAWPRVREGYAKLHDAARQPAAAPSFLRLLLEYPEILGWEWQWTRAYLEFHREIHGAAKWLAPERQFGLGLWHYYFINPLLRAEWDMAEFARGADFIRPILYHVPEGPRVARYVNQLRGTVAGAVGAAELWALFAAVLGLKLPALDAVATRGLPGSFVGQGVRAVKAAAGPGTRVYAGVGVDVFEHGLERAMSPADVEEAVESAIAAGADGMTVSRNYAEMRHANIDAVGRTLRRLGRAAT